MATTSAISASDAKRTIEISGIHVVEDVKTHEKSVGKGWQFAKFYEDGYPTRTPYGLGFVLQVTRRDPEVWEILVSFIADPLWGYVRLFSPQLNPEYAYFFHIRKEEEEDCIRTVMVQLWTPGSRVIYYQGSHLHHFRADDPENWGVLRVPRSEMKREGISMISKDMPTGGYSIIDSRVGWTCLAGKFMNIGLGTDAEVFNPADPWDPMSLPDTPDMRAKVAELKAAGLRINCAWFTEAG